MPSPCIFYVISIRGGSYIMIIDTKNSTKEEKSAVEKRRFFVSFRFIFERININSVSLSSPMENSGDFSRFVRISYNT